MENIDISNNPNEMVKFRESEQYTKITPIHIGGGVIITAYKKEALRHIEEALNLVFDSRADFSDNVSEEFVRAKLNEIIKNVFLNDGINKNNQIISEVGTFLKNIHKEDIVFFIRIFNLKCSKIYDFGNIKLYPNELVVIAEMSKNYSLENYQKESLSKIFTETEKIYSIAEVRVTAAEEIKAKEKAFYNLDQLLNIFRVFSGERQIWIEGYAIPTDQWCISYNITKKSLARMYEASGINFLIRPFDLDELYKLNPQLMYKIESVLKKEDQTQLECKIVNSLVWLGESVKEKDDTHKLLKMVISLEGLLLEKEGCKKYLLAERCALLLSKIFDDKMKVKELIEEVYKLRNDIVHEGKRPFIRKHIFGDMLWIITELNIEFLMSNEFECIKDVQNFVELCKYR